MRLPAPIKRETVDARLKDLSLGTAVLMGRYARQ
jgi:hypothetical protein